jgi:hypothetical protein
MKSRNQTTKNHERLLKQTERYNALKAELQTVGFVCQGSVQTRRIVCGKATCRCQEDPKNRHGPYHYWTRKSAGKTVGMMLSEDELPVYREWIENQRNLERILRAMHSVSTRALALSTGRKAP